MKPDKVILFCVLLIGIISIFGSIVLSGTSEETIQPSNNFTNILKGEDYDEYNKNVQKLRDAGGDGDDGFLAQFKLANAVYSAMKSLIPQSEALISSIGSFMGISEEVTSLIVITVIIVIVFGGIYLIIK